VKFVRALGIVLGLRTAWRKARIDAAYGEEEWRVKRGLAAELAKMRALRKAIDELKREAAEMISAAPWSREVVVELLQQRLQALKQVASGINQGEAQQ
jgi:hypothetical protein